eukprot:m.191975 g.191975  ORF g.191975 m.191975 type:complete len:516 (+) comp14850_c1_seq8:3774-5321(+)
MAVDMGDAAGTVAKMLARDGWTRDSIGKFIGREGRGAILQGYLRAGSYVGQIDAALRQLLEHTALNAEAQQIDRIIEAFSEEFVKQNPSLSDTYGSSEAVHFLCTALLILNTDLTTDAISNHMTKKQFRDSLAGRKDGADFPKQLLDNLYTSIKKEPLVHQATDQSADSGKDCNQEEAVQPKITTASKVVNDFLDIFDIGEDVDRENAKLLGLCKRKTIEEQYGIRSRNRKWRAFHVTLAGVFLLFHEPKHMPQSPDTITLNLSDAVILRNSFARRTKHTRERHVLELITAKGRSFHFSLQTDEMVEEWCQLLNTPAAITSAPPLAGAVGSSRVFKPPLLPIGKSKESCSEMFSRYRKELATCLDQLGELRQAGSESQQSKAAHERILAEYNFRSMQRERLEEYLKIIQTTQPPQPVRQMLPVQLESAQAETETDTDMDQSVPVAVPPLSPIAPATPTSATSTSTKSPTPSRIIQLTYDGPRYRSSLQQNAFEYSAEFRHEQSQKLSDRLFETFV